MTSSQSLYQHLLSLDRHNYSAYQSIQGSYQFPDFTLIIDQVQGDPFAAPSRLRVQISQSKAGFPLPLYATPSREVALRDYLNRQFDQFANAIWDKRGSGKSGLIAIARPCQQVLERTAVLINEQRVEARFVIGLPARGRTILGQQAAALLCEDLPQIVARSLCYPALNPQLIQRHIETVEDADWLRQQLTTQNLVAFVSDGAILPRQSGVSDRPLEKGALPFQSPASLRVQFDCPHQGAITGMGIPRGITLIVGGGYHGKSTLLRAIELGIYNHIPDDGREQLVSDSNAVKIRAEDGRSIVGVDISPFINHLPQGRSTHHFSTENASGSTSQSANIMEALEMGATVLLMDEDTSATNLMIRDRRMQALIAKDQEPITPFIDKVRQLYQDFGVSTILVMGGSGDYFDVADTVIAMADYQPQEVTAQAKAIAQTYATRRIPEGGERFGRLTPRIPHAVTTKSADIRSPRLKVRDTEKLLFGTMEIDLSAVGQIVDAGQVRAIGSALLYIQQHYLDGHQTLAEIVRRVMANLKAESLDSLTLYPQGDLTQFRTFELAAVFNRLRSLEIQN